jgi:DNA mismatch repair protein MutL
MILSGQDVESTVQEIAAGLANGGNEVLTAKLDWIYHSTACRAATKAGDASRHAELEEIARRVLLHEDIRYCPHGRPVCIEMTRKELEKQFGRIL